MSQETPLSEFTLQQQALNLVKARAIDKLREHGYRLNHQTATKEVMARILSLTRRRAGSKSPIQYMTEFVDAHVYAGERVPARTPTPFKPLVLDRKTRMAFERASRAQPPVMTPNGYGARTRSWGGQGGESR